jgi:hypothetical protein
MQLHFWPAAAGDLRAHLESEGVSQPLLTLAERCYMLPMLASALRRAGVEIPDAATRSALEGAYYACAARRAALRMTMERVADHLTEAGLPFLFLKGAALEVLAPQAPSVRITADLDVLVPRGEMANAEDRLERAGFRPRYARQEQLFRRHGHHGVPYELADGIGTVEIHEALAPRCSPVDLPVAPFWERSRPVVWSGRTIRVPAADEMVLHTCIHYGLLHPYNTSLRRLWDLLLLLETIAEPIDGSRVTETARRWGGSKVVARGMAELEAIRNGWDLGGLALFDEPYSAVGALRQEQALTDGPWRRLLGLWRFLFPGPHETAPLRAEVAHWRYLLARCVRSSELR